MLNTKRLGNYIKELRNEAKLTVQELAAEIQWDHGHLSNVEGGRRVPSPGLLIDIARRFNVPSGALFQLLDDTDMGISSLSPERQLVVDKLVGDLLSLERYERRVVVDMVKDEATKRQIEEMKQLAKDEAKAEKERKATEKEAEKEAKKNQNKMVPVLYIKM